MMHDGKLSCFDATNNWQMSQDGEMNNREEPEEKCQDIQKQRKESNWLKKLEPDSSLTS